MGAKTSGCKSGEDFLADVYGKLAARLHVDIENTCTGTLRLQVDTYLLWGLNYVDMTYFGFGGPGVEKHLRHCTNMKMSCDEILFVPELPEVLSRNMP